MVSHDNHMMMMMMSHNDHVMVVPHGSHMVITEQGGHTIVRGGAVEGEGGERHRSSRNPYLQTERLLPTLNTQNLQTQNFLRTIIIQPGAYIPLSILFTTAVVRTENNKNSSFSLNLGTMY